MKRLLAISLLLASCGTGFRPSGDTLKQIGDDYWRHELDENVALQIKFGIPTRHLPDVSYAHAQREAEFALSIVQRLDRINSTAFSEDDRLTFKILRWETQLSIDGLPYFWYRFQVTPYSFRNLGIQQVFTMQRLTDADRTRLLNELPRLADQMLEVLRQQRERGIVLPKAEVPIVKQTISRAIPGNPSLQRLADSISETNAP